MFYTTRYNIVPIHRTIIKFFHKIILQSIADKSTLHTKILGQIHWENWLVLEVYLVFTNNFYESQS